MTIRNGEVVEVAKAKGRPMLSWVGKRPLREVQRSRHNWWSGSRPRTLDGIVAGDVDWTEWPERLHRYARRRAPGRGRRSAQIPLSQVPLSQDPLSQVPLRTLLRVPAVWRPMMAPPAKPGLAPPYGHRRPPLTG